MQQFAFALGEFATQEDFLLGVADAAHVGKCVRVHQVVPAELVGDISRKSGFGIFVEALQQGYSEHVLYTECSGRVVTVILVKFVVFREESFGLASRTELVPRPFYFQGMDKAGDGDELFFEK